MILCFIIILQIFNFSKRFLHSFQATKWLYAVMAIKHVFWCNNICYVVRSDAVYKQATSNLAMYSEETSHDKLPEA